MLRSITTVLLFCLTLAACGQNNPQKVIRGLTIDPAIKEEVEKHIENAKELDVFKNAMQVYVNSGVIQLYENDKLILDSKMGENKAPFKSFYLWRGDTLTIDGAFGLFTGIGFDINIVNNEATLRHLLSADEIPSYAYSEKDSLIFRLEVPCRDTKIILSEVPDSVKKQIIYGYVEFKSEDYYTSSGSVERQEILPRKKMRSNMKLYFKSGYLNF